MLKRPEFTLIGAGIMSATLGILLKELMPDATIAIFERLDQAGAESSDAWNNAGTGHSAFCELNYTPEREDGTVDISKALKIGEAFEVSKQLWAYLKENDLVNTGHPFINDIDHMSFVRGPENISFLQKRHDAMTQYEMFADMQYSTSFAEIAGWAPLMMEGRDPDEQVAATRMAIGTDVNFGAITRGMINHLQSCDGVELYLGHEVEGLTKERDGTWKVRVKDLHHKTERSVHSRFVFIGAGGGALQLLDKSDIAEARGYGGFPISGQFLRCTNPEVVSRHEAKVYGKASEGAPPMSVPHLDTRILDGERSLLFGPYAGFSTKFLKNGSYFDLPLSIEMHNVWPMLSAGAKNIPLTKYLVEQVFQSPEDRFKLLRQFYPEARFQDWELITAGQRVQIIKGNDKGGGVLQFGTEIVSSSDRSLAALLGASPGASTSVSIMLDLLATCFPVEMQSRVWQARLVKMIPSYGQSLITDGALCRQIRDYTSAVLKLA